jgi:hypothetical protein
MASPWDGVDGAVTVLRAEEHSIIGVQVSPPANGDDRFAISFQTHSNRVLRVMLPGDQLTELARVLFALANERRWRDDVREPQEVIS